MRQGGFESFSLMRAQPCHADHMNQSSAAPQQSTAEAYDSIAEGYAAENDASLLNEYYNRPALMDLLGDVSGRHVLDAGCGSGPILTDLLSRGATVAGFDSSRGMLEIARERLGAEVDLRVANLAQPLPFATGEFDDVVCSLALHYLKDWSGPLAELKCLLKPSGRLVLSVEHPFATWLGQREQGVKTNYFATRPRAEHWSMNGQEATLEFWDRSLSSMVESFVSAGFRITHLGEPAPSDRAREKYPELFEGREDPRFLAFLFVVLEA